MIRIGAASTVAVVLVVVVLAASCSSAGGETDGPQTGSAGAGVKVGDTVALVGEVGPGADGPLPGLDRDAGVNAVLGDGSVVWFFGDTAQRNPDGSLAFFEVGSAAWATAEDPLVTLDHVDDGRVKPFAELTAEFAPCPTEAPEPGMWPLAAVTDPGDANRVILGMANVCLGPDRTLVDHGISVGEWVHDPQNPPVGQPVTVEVLEQNLFPDAALGDAAVVVDDHVVVYGCEPPDSAGVVVTDPGHCVAARVSPESVADASSYEVWTGDEWSRGGEPATMEMPPDAEGTVAPPGPVSVAATPGGEGFVMAYTPWPGFAPWIDIRLAGSPVGPWSAPRRVDLDGCDPGPDADEACYAANLQPLLDEDGYLGVGYYDRSVPAGGTRGGFLVGRVDFDWAPEG
ncbi:MAG: hypothetical protein R2716_08165 [Microthrixaceae bacterium]